MFSCLGVGVEKKFWQENNKSGSTYWQFSMRSVVMWIECYHMMENTLFFRPPPPSPNASLRRDSRDTPKDQTSRHFLGVLGECQSQTRPLSKLILLARCYVLLWTPQQVNFTSPVLCALINKSETQEELQWIAAETPLLALTIPGYGKVVYNRFIISSLRKNMNPTLPAQNITWNRAQA